MPGGRDVQGDHGDGGAGSLDGARHLQRNIERLLLEPLASVAERELAAEVSMAHWFPW